MIPNPNCHWPKIPIATPTSRQQLREPSLGMKFFRRVPEGLRDGNPTPTPWKMNGWWFGRWVPFSKIGWVLLVPSDTFQGGVGFKWFLFQGVFFCESVSKMMINFYQTKPLKMIDSWSAMDFKLIFQVRFYQVVFLFQFQMMINFYLEKPSKKLRWFSSMKLQVFRFKKAGRTLKNRFLVAVSATGSLVWVCFKWKHGLINKHKPSKSVLHTWITWFFKRKLSVYIPGPSSLGALHGSGPKECQFIIP